MRKTSLGAMTEFLAQLRALRPHMAAAAQSVYDDWAQDEEGLDECYGPGGICDDVADALAGVIASHLEDVELFQGGQDGDDHAWTVAQRGGEAYGVDIRPGVYETGSGYCWRKRPGVVFHPEHVEIFAIDPIRDRDL